MGNKPDWCTWWTDGEWSRFERLLKVIDRNRILFAKAQRPDAEPGAADAILRTVAEAVYQGPPGKWSATITDLVKQEEGADQASDSGSGSPAAEQPSTLDEGQAADLRSQVMVRDDVLGQLDGLEQGADPLTRPLGGGLHEVLQLITDGVRQTPDRSFFQTWGNPDELFAISRKNTGEESVQGDYDEATRVFTLRSSEHDLVAARVTLFGNSKKESPAGFLVMLPDRHCLMFHRIEGGGEAFANGLTALIAGGRKAYADAANPFSDKLFWWRPGVLSEVPVRTDGEEAKADVPQELWDAVRAPAADTSRKKERLSTTARDLQRTARVQVMRHADALAATSGAVTRSIGADLVEVLQSELSDGRVGFLDWTYIESQKANVDAVFEIGRANVAAQSVTKDPVEVRGDAEVYLLTSDDSNFVAARVLLLDEEPDIPPYGHLVMLPNPFTLLYHPIRDGQSLIQAFDMVPMARYMNDKMREMTQGQMSEFLISDNPYWWRDGKLTEIPVSIQGGAIQIEAPTSFQSVARAIGADL